MDTVLLNICPCVLTFMIYMYRTKINGVSCELREPIIKDLLFIGDKVDTLGKSRVSDIQ